ncbi:HlyD family secretion protein [Rhizobium aouanii]|uniref:HlyD family secretion protein n=1 Tax=Rhizobium aouanii TaxID=3118145 RepID=A0ABU8CHZ9_9HYPH
MRQVLKVIVLGSIACLLMGFASTWGVNYWQAGRFEEATDNAYIRGDITSLAPRVAGYVTKVNVDDNAMVKAGDVLFTIDDKDYRARLAQTEANLAAARAALANNRAEQQLQQATIIQVDAQRQAAVASRLLTEQNLARALNLVRANVATRAQVEAMQSARDQANSTVEAAEAALAAQRSKLSVIAAQREAAEASIAQATAARDLVRIDLENTVVRAPIDGVIGNRQVRLGRYVTPGQALIDIVPVANIWVVANFKETQLEHMKIGQNVRITVDGFRDVKIEGVVTSFAPGSGSAFSLLPSDNATGNFVRVVQRVPVKISLSGNPLSGRLVPGLSAKVAVWIGSPEEAK